MHNNIPTVYISEIYCNIVKSNSFNYFWRVDKKYNKNYNYRVAMATLT
jgi:hypothetical protein